ncbi:four helix bundle protein [Neolewinella lacunae]|nr:four helix bundle protein [Neolewinella lacunae]MDN3635165.1 four helix bundle protein [Neolewinella lacunae]
MNYLDTYLPIDDHFEVAEPKSPYKQRDSNVEFAAKMRQRTKAAAIAIVNLMGKQKETPVLRVISFQLLKSATSAAANYRAACRARSTNEFYAKMSIVVEETDETLFWLEMLHDSEIPIDKAAVTLLGKEWQEILMIMAKSRSNVKK